ncbi:MAG: DegT/DnrJ/EryC1/StrS family aminotransferase [Methanoregula sp.]
MIWKIPLFKMFWDEDDLTQVTSKIKSGMSWAAGPEIQVFEEMIADYQGSKYCVSFNSGTSALHATLLAYGLGPGDEIIVPSFTFIATANAPLFVGAKPVFADIEETTLGLNPEDVAEKITIRTKAIMPIHYGGVPCRIKELKEVAEDNNILLIEDAAEALGAVTGNQKVGSIGDSGMLSFCQNKIITTGEGGAIITDNRDVFEKLKLIRSHGRPDTIDYFTTTDVLDYISLGYNFRMSTISAALGIAQMGKVNKLIYTRRKDADYYRSSLRGTGDIMFVDGNPGDISVYQLFSIRTKYRDAIVKFLAEKSIMTKIYFSPIHKTHFYQNVLKYNIDLPVTEKVSNDIMSLPFYPGIPRNDLDCVSSAIKEGIECQK